MICVTFGPVPMTREQYHAIGERIPEPPDGREFHVCYGEDGALYVTEIWSSEQDLHRHNADLAEVLADVFDEPVALNRTTLPVVGIQRPGEPPAIVD